VREEQKTKKKNKKTKTKKTFFVKLTALLEAAKNKQLIWVLLQANWTAFGYLVRVVRQETLWNV